MRHAPLSAHGSLRPCVRACARAQPKPIVSGAAAGDAPPIGIGSLATVELRGRLGGAVYGESAALADVLIFDAPTGKEFR